MTRYHIAASGKSAVCKAQFEASCPRGGRHFDSKDRADFYAENIAPLNPPPAIEQALVDAVDGATVTKKQPTLQELDDTELRRRQHALTAVQIAEELGDEEDVRDARRELDRLDPVEGDPAWDLGEVNREFLKRLHEPKHAPLTPEQVARKAVPLKKPGTGPFIPQTVGPEPMPSPAQPQPSYVTDHQLASVRQLDDETLQAHHAALTQYRIAKQYGDDEELTKATARLQELGDKAAAYSWAPLAAQERVQAEFVRRQAVLTLLQEELPSRLYDAARKLRDLRVAAYPEKDDAERARLTNKLAAVRYFRQHWAPEINRATSYDRVLLTLEVVKAEQDRPGWPKPAGYSNPGWREGIDLARSYVEDYMRGA